MGRSEQGYFVAHTDALDEPAVGSVFAHELAHMWFGNAVDATPPGDDMMDEAIANYAVALVREDTDGKEAADRRTGEWASRLQRAGVLPLRQTRRGRAIARVLAVQLMQRIGIQDGWPVVPDY